MNTLQSLKQPGPYSTPVKVKVVIKSDLITSRSGTKYRQLAIADGTAAKKALCYDEDVAQKMTEGRSYILKNVGIVNEAVVINKKSKVSITSEIDLDETKVNEARNILFPPDAEQKTIEECEILKPGTMVCIEGLIVEEALKRQVMVNNQPTTIRDVTLQENEKKITVTLWREHAENNCVSIGQFANFSNIILKRFNNNNVAHTTSRTKIMVTQMPTKQEEIEVHAYESFEEEGYLLFNCLIEVDGVSSDMVDRKITTETLREKMNLDPLELINRLPLRMTATVRGVIIEDVQLQD